MLLDRPSTEPDELPGPGDLTAGKEVSPDVPNREWRLRIRDALRAGEPDLALALSELAGIPERDYFVRYAYVYLNDGLLLEAIRLFDALGEEPPRELLIENATQNLRQPTLERPGGLDRILYAFRRAGVEPPKEELRRYGERCLRLGAPDVAAEAFLIAGDISRFRGALSLRVQQGLPATKDPGFGAGRREEST